MQISRLSRRNGGRSADEKKVDKKKTIHRNDNSWNKKKEIGRNILKNSIHFLRIETNKSRIETISSKEMSVEILQY